MMSLARLGYALSAAGLAVASPAMADSAGASVATTRTSATRTDIPVEAVGDTAPIRGGWTRDGWSDAAAGQRQADVPPPPPARARIAAAGPDGAEPPRGYDDGPPPREMRHDGRDGDGRRDGDWRRQTWDGGRGPGFRYRRGERLAAIFTAPRYIVPDWPEYGLRRPGPGQRWVRYYDDAVLLDPRGYVVDAAPRIGWDDGRWNAPDLAYDPGFRHDGRWRDDGVAVGGGALGGDNGGPCYGCAPGGATVVTIRSPGVATTTTTTTETYVTTSRRWIRPVAYRAPTKQVKRGKLLARNR